MTYATAMVSLAVDLPNDALQQQCARRLDDGSIHCRGDDLPGHDLMGAHRLFSA